MHPRSQAASVPNLFRAVAECTQPYGPPATVAAVRSLQVGFSLHQGTCRHCMLFVLSRSQPDCVSLNTAHSQIMSPLQHLPCCAVQAYLSDDSCVDSVYKAILARACAEPQRWAGLQCFLSLLLQLTHVAVVCVRRIWWELLYAHGVGALGAACFTTSVHPCLQNSSRMPFIKEQHVTPVCPRVCLAVKLSSPSASPWSGSMRQGEVQC